jgi:hypothetical protein
MNRSFKILKNKFPKFPKKLRLDERKLRQELVLSKLESKLGKPKKELRSLISDNLLNLLSQVPFTF